MVKYDAINHTIHNLHVNVDTVRILFDCKVAHEQDGKYFPER